MSKKRVKNKEATPLPLPPSALRQVASALSASLAWRTRRQSKRKSGCTSWLTTQARSWAIIVRAIPRTKLFAERRRRAAMVDPTRNVRTLALRRSERARKKLLMGTMKRKNVSPLCRRSKHSTSTSQSKKTTRESKPLFWKCELNTTRTRSRNTAKSNATECRRSEIS